MSVDIIETRSLKMLLKSFHENFSDFLNSSCWVCMISVHLFRRIFSVIEQVTDKCAKSKFLSKCKGPVTLKHVAPLDVT